MELAFLRLKQDIPSRMPILERWVKQHRQAQPLAGITALFIQHQLGNQVPQVRAMLKLGLKPDRLFWLDVPYTSNPRVREALVALGIPSKNLICADDYWVLEPYAPYQRRRVQQIIHGFLDDPPERLLVLDDGAYFLEAASCFGRRLPSVAVVEQTTRGLIKLESSPALQAYAQGLPVVDVARSAPKRTLEPPFIGRAVCSALYRKLRQRFAPGHNARCLILGLGAIGSQVTRFAVDYLGFKAEHVHVFDPLKRRLREAQARGYSLWNRRDLNPRFQLVIGCSGRASFKVHDYVYLMDNAVLASASSGSVELSREDFIELADTCKIDDIRIHRRGLDEENIHSDLRIQLVDREVTFLNGGFPVNFDGRVNCVPTRYMQPTATMMVAASVQAVSTSARNVVRLNRDFCRWLDQEFRQQLGDEAARLLPPPTETG